MKECKRMCEDVISSLKEIGKYILSNLSIRYILKELYFINGFEYKMLVCFTFHWNLRQSKHT